MTKIATVGDVVTKAIAKNWKEGDIAGQLSMDKTNCPTYFQLMALRLGGSSGRALTINGTYENNQLVKNSDISVPDAIAYVNKTITFEFTAPDEITNIYTEPQIFECQYYIDDVLQDTYHLPDQTLDPGGDNVIHTETIEMSEENESAEHKIIIEYIGNENLYTDGDWVLCDMATVESNENSCIVTWRNWSDNNINIQITARKQ